MVNYLLYVEKDHDSTTKSKIRKQTHSSLALWHKEHLDVKESRHDEPLTSETQFHEEVAAHDVSILFGQLRSAITLLRVEPFGSRGIPEEHQHVQATMLCGTVQGSLALHFPWGCVDVGA